MHITFETEFYWLVGLTGFWLGLCAITAARAFGEQAAKAITNLWRQ